MQFHENILEPHLFHGDFRVEAPLQLPFEIGMPMTRDDTGASTGHLLTDYVIEPKRRGQCVTAVNMQTHHGFLERIELAGPGDIALADYDDPVRDPLEIRDYMRGEQHRTRFVRRRIAPPATVPVAQPKGGL